MMITFLFTRESANKVDENVKCSLRFCFINEHQNDVEYFGLLKESTLLKIRRDFETRIYSLTFICTGLGT